MSEQMKAPDAKAVKMVKIKALMPIQVGDNLIAAGQTVEVDEKMADQFCKPISGVYDFGGERYGEPTRHITKRAERAA